MNISRANHKPASLLLRLHTLLVYAFLYAPIIVLVVFSFNSDRRNASWQGFTIDWYFSLMHNEAIQRALLNSLQVGLISTAIATLIGTLAAIALSRHRLPGHDLISSLVFVPLVVPEIVTGISILTLFLLIGQKLSLLTVILAHVAFCISYVTISVRVRLAGMDPSLEEAASDLGATDWEAFRYVTLPQIIPGVVSGALLCFTLSFDDFVITFFNAGVGCGTLPMTIHSMLKFGITPEINAISTIMLVCSVSLMIIYGWTDSASKNQD